MNDSYSMIHANHFRTCGKLVFFVLTFSSSKSHTVFYLNQYFYEKKIRKYLSYSICKVVAMAIQPVYM